MIWAFGFTVVVLAVCIARLEREIKRVYRKMRQVNTRLEILEKSAGISDEKTNTDVAYKRR